ncbi:hypothetical protein C1H46_015922 [Malus baccata]|uniref:LNS2/PITP domain-containing protein n=1 Tax=Malus baccata TaxID=106549 RepID=A0A540MI50_MALBA|nr:hypothetical protein C1H46_015922 [Malus baccata]
MQRKRFIWITEWNDIKSLFPSDCNPFYAGFGNRDTDEFSYLKVGIPKGKIFIINPKGEVVVNRRVDTKSYTSLHALVNGMFPPTNSSEQVLILQCFFVLNMLRSRRTLIRGISGNSHRAILMFEVLKRVYCFIFSPALDMETDEFCHARV